MAAGLSEHSDFREVGWGGWHSVIVLVLVLVLVLQVGRYLVST